MGTSFPNFQLGLAAPRELRGPCAGDGLPHKFIRSISNRKTEIGVRVRKRWRRRRGWGWRVSRCLVGNLRWARLPVGTGHVMLASIPSPRLYSQLPAEGRASPSEIRPMVAEPGENKVREIYELLPKLNCGACGYSSCWECARAIASGLAPPDACRVAGRSLSPQIQRILTKR